MDLGTGRIIESKPFGINGFHRSQVFRDASRLALFGRVTVAQCCILIGADILALSVAGSRVGSALIRSLAKAIPDDL